MCVALDEPACKIFSNRPPEVGKFLADHAELGFCQFAYNRIFSSNHRCGASLARLNSSHLTDGVASKTPRHLPAVYDDVERARDDEVNIVVICVLLDDRISRLDRNEFACSGNALGESSIAADDLLPSQRVDQRPSSAFTFKSLDHCQPV